ncbi:hypothetical protein [Streptomyces sp. NPDC059949]|uniref:hypothetical protein n=1 Tax=Streptomyces sp. NPDC059949 TaxID=3347013 RepID=UPI00365D6BC9
MNRNPSRLRRAVRVAAPALAALSLTLAFAGPAAADPSFVMRSGGEVRFAALPGERNTVTFAVVTGNIVVSDTTSPVTAGPGCTQLSANSVRCGASTGVTRIQAALGNEDDVVTNNTAVPADIDGGSGEDRINGGSGNDRLTDPDGWNSSPSGTSFSGGGGNDTIVSKNGGFDRISCGGGFDLLVADSAALDALVPTPGHGCEFVIR